MVDNSFNSEKNIVKAKISISGFQFKSMTVKEIIMNESLLNPGLQTAVTLQSYIYADGGKNFDAMKNRELTLEMRTDNGKNSIINQKVYRLDNRFMMPVNIGQTEEFTIHACDQTLLNDAKSLVSKSWKCTNPGEIVRYVLSSCAGAASVVLDPGNIQPARDYIAENIHPFQVVAQQANVALNGNDPDFVHFMTYNTTGGPGIHNFKSLRAMCNKPAIKDFYKYETGKPYNEHQPDRRVPAMAFTFPCDFDLLSDILNGLDESGANKNTLMVFNPASASFAQLGNESGGCGMGGFNAKMSMTNKGTATQHNGCESDVEQHLLKRQARMSLLEKDKVALRLISTWQPDVHAGDVISFDWQNKYGGAPVYGTGYYLVSSLNHNIQFGGYGTTTLDCVSVTSGGGIV